MACLWNPEKFCKNWSLLNLPRTLIIELTFETIYLPLLTMQKSDRRDFCQQTTYENVWVCMCVCACVCVCTYIDFFIIFESWTFQFFLFWVFDFSILWCHDSFICVPWVWARPSKLLQENDLFVCIWKWQGSLFWVFCIFQKKNSDITHFCTWPSYWYWTVQTFVSTPVWVHTYSTQTS